jgi:hypothetical protein
LHTLHPFGAVATLEVAVGLVWVLVFALLPWNGILAYALLPYAPAAYV